MSSGYKEYDKKIIDKLHGVELEIMDEIDRICKKNNINYFLCGGSMLGAIRHNGFIPWDDDIDIGMTRRDYDKFIEVCKRDLNDGYMLDDISTNKNCFLPFMKIRKKNTLFDEVVSKNVDGYKGIFVDIFPFENCKDKDNKLQYFKAFVVKNMHQAVCYRYGITKFKNVRHKVFCLLCYIFPRRFLLKLSINLSKNNSDDNSEFISCYCGYPFKKECIPRSSVFPTKEYEFEDRKYMGMNNPDIYLSQIYGDYMKLPPKEKRVNHLPEVVIFDCEKGE